MAITFNIEGNKTVIVSSENTGKTVINTGKGFGTDKNQNLKFMLAVVSGDIDTIQKFLKAGSDPNEKDVFGNTPIIFAVHSNQQEAAILLCEAGANPTEVIESIGKNAVDLAKLYGFEEFANKLMRIWSKKNA